MNVTLTDKIQFSRFVAAAIMLWGEEIHQLLVTNLPAGLRQKLTMFASQAQVPEHVYVEEHAGLFVRVVRTKEFRQVQGASGTKEQFVEDGYRLTVEPRQPSLVCGVSLACSLTMPRDQITAEGMQPLETKLTARFDPDYMCPPLIISQLLAIQETLKVKGDASCYIGGTGSAGMTFAQLVQHFAQVWVVGSTLRRTNP